VRDLDGTFSLPRLKALLPHVNAVTVKLSQGAKPGGGGILPAAKVTREIATIRNIPFGKECHSPERFSEFDDVPSMLAWIAMLQRETGKPVGLKFCLGDKRFVQELIDNLRGTADDVGPDYIILDGSEGGTGAAPPTLADNMGTPIRQSLPWLDNQLRAAGLRDRIRIVAAGRFALASEVAFGLAMGADYVNIARGFMLAMGCIQAQECHTNHCPTGITTHSKLALVRSVGLASPAELNRHHVMVNDDDHAAHSLADLFPYPEGFDPGVPLTVAERTRGARAGGGNNLQAVS
jgi:glutamate synthase domain-containing protein 2